MSTSTRVLQRFVMPADGDADILQLYAEGEIISRILGQHVQPLATIADGNGICTTNIPITPIDRRSNA